MAVKLDCCISIRAMKETEKGENRSKEPPSSVADSINHQSHEAHCEPKGTQIADVLETVNDICLTQLLPPNTFQS